MFLPPPPANNDDNRISDKPLPAPMPQGVPSDAKPADVPNEEEMFYYVNDCLERGSSKAEIRKQLIAFGYSTEDAKQAVEDVLEWRRQNPGQKAYPDAPNIAAPAASGDGTTQMLIGGGICLLGILITVGTCMAASGPGGGTYTIAWGAIIFGAIQFFRGLSMSNQR